MGMEQSNQSALRSVASFISYICHPLFIPIWITMLTVTAFPEYFVQFKNQSLRFEYDVLYFRVGVTCVLLPLLVVVLAQKLKFVDSIKLQGQQERIIPYVATMIFYFWAFYTFLRQGISPDFFTAFFLGIFIAVIVAFIANIFVKVSMHLTGWGGVVGYLFGLMWVMQTNVAIPLAIAFLLTGIVASARLSLYAHSPRELVAGIFIGMVSQLSAFFILY
jgi:hypothetical protein